VETTSTLSAYVELSTHTAYTVHAGWAAANERKGALRVVCCYSGVGGQSATAAAWLECLRLACSTRQPAPSRASSPRFPHHQPPCCCCCFRTPPPSDNRQTPVSSCFVIPIHTGHRHTTASAIHAYRAHRISRTRGAQPADRVRGRQGCLRWVAAAIRTHGGFDSKQSVSSRHCGITGGFGIVTAATAFWTAPVVVVNHPPLDTVFRGTRTCPLRPYLPRLHSSGQEETVHAYSSGAVL